MTAPVEMVKQFWEGRAEAPGVGDSEVTHADVWQRELEIETILKYLGRGDRVLDVGCGSGYTTKRLAPHVAEVIGVDYSDAMIRRAGRGGAGAGPPPRRAGRDPPRPPTPPPPPHPPPPLTT